MFRYSERFLFRCKSSGDHACSETSWRYAAVEYRNSEPLECEGSSVKFVKSELIRRDERKESASPCRIAWLEFADGAKQTAQSIMLWAGWKSWPSLVVVASPRSVCQWPTDADRNEQMSFCDQHDIHPSSGQTRRTL